MKDLKAKIESIFADINFVGEYEFSGDEQKAIKKILALFKKRDENLILKIEGIDRKAHICRFNDGEQNCDCYFEALDSVLELIHSESIK